MKFKARGIQAALGKTSNGNPQVAVELEITEGERQGDTLTWYGYFTDKTEERTIQSLRLLGWEGDDLSSLIGIDQNEVTIVVEEEEYDGQVREKVKWINGGGLAMKETMDDGAAKAFAAKMRGKVLAVSKAMPRAKPANGQKPPAQKPPSEDDLKGDDIPF